MSDWRGGDERREKIPSKDRIPKRLPVVPPLENLPNPKKDWRGWAKSTAPGTSAGERSWTGATKSQAPKTFVLQKSALVGFLGLVIVGSILTFIVVLLRKTDKLPLIISSSEIYGMRDLGQNAFGSQTLEFVSRIPTKNLRPILHGPEYNEQFLKEVGGNDNWIKSYSEVKSKGLASTGNFQGAGPGKNVTAYFVSCLIVCAGESESDEWLLVSENDDPYGKKSDARGLPISKFLERVANQTKPNCLAWIALDVKPPSVVANLGDLSFPLAAFEKAFRGLAIELQDRLILTLPCDESQESWMAPEFSSSVFAHYFLQGLAAGFETEQGVVTLDAFENQLSDKVRSWVAMHRVAHQMPKFLMSDKTNKAKRTIKLFETTGVAKDSFNAIATKKEDLVSKFQQLDPLWSSFESLRTCSRWEPLAYAEIESQLLQMEDLAEAGAISSFWSTCLKDTELNIEKLRRNTTFSRRVSLIETKSNSRVRPCNVFSPGILAGSDSIETAWIANPPFWQGSTSNSGSDGKTDSTQEGAGLTRNDRCLQVWSVMQKTAQSDDAKNWARVFNREKLDRSLAYIGSLEESDNNEWLEIQILRILLTEIEWTTASEQSANATSTAIAKTLAAFADLQEVASSPDRELTWWTQGRLASLDQDFLKAFDLLVADQSDTCVQILDKLANPVASLKLFRDRLQACMTSRDRTFRVAPHALASLMRLHRYVSKASETNQNMADSQYEKLAKGLGDAICQAVEMKDFLLNSDAKEIPPNIDTNPLFEGVVSELEKEFASQKVLAKRDAETIRNCRIALRWPMLPLSTRKEFHDQLANYYAKTKEEPQSKDISSAARDRNAISEISHRSPRTIADVFTKRLKNINELNLYTLMAQRDLRIEFGNRLTESPNSRSKELLNEIYATSFRMREQASTYGQLASSGVASEVSWPWNSVSQFQRLCEANYNAMQIQRLFTARWGDGDLNAPSKNKYFFQRLASQYQRPRELLNDFALAARAMETDPAALNRSEDIAYQELMDIELSMSAPVSESEANSEPWTKMQATLKCQPWQATVALKFGKPQRKPLSPSSKERALAVSLDRSSQQRELHLPAESFGQESLSLSLRGHSHEYAIPKPSQKNSYQVSFERTPKNDSTLHVTAKNSEPITVLVLFDCSGSMGDSHQAAKAIVLSLFSELQKLNRNGENPVQVGLIPFGLKLKKTKGEEPSKSQRIAESMGLTQSDVGDQVFYTDIKNGADINQLESTVRMLKSSGCTPLYDAIYFACTMHPNRRTRIVVVSDGSNDVPLQGGSNDYIYYVGKNYNQSQVYEAIERSKSTLFVFQFKNDYYDRKLDQEQIAQAKKSNAELTDLLKRLSEIGKGKQNPQLFYDNFEMMSKDLLASFPKSNVQVRTDKADARMVSEGSFGEEIRIPYNTEPYWAIAEVESMGDIALRKQKARVWITGNQKLELRYKTDSNELDFIEFSDEANVNIYNFRFDPNETGLDLLARPIQDRSRSELLMQTAIRGKSAESERKNFTRAPKFVVAELKTSGGETARSYLIADVDLVPRTHYPILKFPVVPWGKNKQWFSPRGDFEIWFADEIPTNALRASLEADASLELMGGRVQCNRSNNRLTVNVKSVDDDRLIVYCAQAQSSLRTYPDNQAGDELRSERHQFELGDSDGKPVEIVLMKFNDLKKNGSQMGLKHVHLQNKVFTK